MLRVFLVSGDHGALQWKGAAALVDLINIFLSEKQSDLVTEKSPLEWPSTEQPLTSMP